MRRVTATTRSDLMAAVSSFFFNCLIIVSFVPPTLSGSAVGRGEAPLPYTVGRGLVVNPEASVRCSSLFVIS